ncbi:MAG TPA: type 2 lanthipeptide synthetase LanM family protein, partial [Pseudonocardiaceae bacterium]|nr:type 2 lanthipeptide synthetase LanM family protein [Pseudonocardiaceae bacterium]
MHTVPPRAVPRGIDVRPSWWAGGLALAERLPVHRTDAGEPAEAKRRLTQWLDGNAGMAARLTDFGLDSADLLDLLAEPVDALAARTSKPAWATMLDRVLTADGSGFDGTTPQSPVPGHVGDATMLLPALAPFLAAAGDRIQHDTADVDLPAVRAAVLDHLGRRLTRLAARTLVVELADARSAGRLSGADGTDRFADFLRQVAGPERLALLSGYPVLARLLAQASHNAVAAGVELLDRFEADRATIVDTLLDGRDPGRLVSVELGAGDGHQGGRSVAVLRFADGASVVYKPRSLALQAHFADLVAWLNGRVHGLDLRAVRTLPMAGYGWLEHIEHRPCAELSDVDLFYHRQGALLALLYAVDGTDFHHENLIACADQPVLVDVETLFHPTLPPVPATGPDPAIRALTTSVGRTALLPTMLLGEHGALDISGVGGGQDGMYPADVVRWLDPGTDRMRLVRRPAEFTGGTNRPKLPGHDLDPAAHELALLAGFRDAYDAIVAHRADLLAPDGPLVGCAGDDIRIIARHTAGYLELMDESTHPDLLRDGLDREPTFDVLWTDAPDDVRRRLVPYELADMWAGDVPLFTTRPGSTDVWTSDGQRLADVLPTSGLAAVTAKLARLGDVDRHDQDWLISATLASRERTVEHRSGITVPAPVRATPPDPQRLLTLACELADDLVARAVHDDDRANWLGLELVDGKHWTVLPMGAGLAEGYCGVALFLAQLGELTGLSRYPELARKAVTPLPRLLDMLTDDPTLAGEVGCGGFAGIGGLCYALARLSTLLADGDMVRWLAAAVPLVVTADEGRTENLSRDTALGTGRAGGLAALLAVHAETGLTSALRSAVVLADRLADAWDEPTARPDDGLLTGAAGEGWALLRAAEVTGSQRHAAAGRTALRHDRGLADRLDQTDRVDRVDRVGKAPVDLGRCGGLAGAVLARIGTKDDKAADADASTEKWLDEAIVALGEHRPLRDTSL